MSASEYLAPVPQWVAGRASLEAVYHLGIEKWKNQPKFRNAFTRDFGKLIEKYAGEQLDQVPGAALSGERPYGKGGGSKTVDWILVLPRVVLLVEVKNARVAAMGRLDVEGWTVDVRRDVGKGMSQIATTADLLRGRHSIFNDIPADRPLRAVVVTAEPHHLINSPIYRRSLPDATIPTTVMSLQTLERAVAHTLVRDPSEVFLALTESSEHEAMNHEQLMRRWQQQGGVQGRLPNPLLDAGWQRYSWHLEAPPGADGEAVEV